MASSSPVLQLPARVEALSGLSAIPTEYVRPADERASLGDAFDLARTHANDHTAPRIPVVDISAFLDATSSQQQRDACVEAVRAAAAVHIAGHGIPAELTDRLRAAGAAFFALPIRDKEAYANDPAAGRLQGYGSRLANNACGQREWEDYLFHLLHPDALADHTLWPAHCTRPILAPFEGKRVLKKNDIKKLPFNHPFSRKF